MSALLLNVVVYPTLDLSIHFDTIGHGIFGRRETFGQLGTVLCNNFQWVKISTSNPEYADSIQHPSKLCFWIVLLTPDTNSVLKPVPNIAYEDVKKSRKLKSKTKDVLFRLLYILLYDFRFA